MTRYDTQKISCVVPLYNEEKRVLNVLAALVDHQLITEVIVINDGSTDHSEQILKNLNKIKLISYKNNKGKSFALMEGIKAAQYDLILTIDSDLIGLTKENLTSLIEPVISGQADVSMSLRKNSPRIFRLIGLDYISGERVFSKSIIPDLSVLEHLSCFALESYLNDLMLANKARIKVVFWNNVVSPYKVFKFGLWKGILGDLKMYHDLLKYNGLLGLYRQIIGLLKLRTK